MDIITIKKNDPLFTETFKAIGSDCPETYWYHAYSKICQKVWKANQVCLFQRQE